MVVPEKNPSEHIPVGQENPANFAHFSNHETDLLNNLDSHNSEEPNVQSTAPLSTADLNLNNASTHRPTASIRPISKQPFKKPTEMNFKNFNYIQGLVKPETFFRQQQPGPSANSLVTPFLHQDPGSVRFTNQYSRFPIRPENYTNLVNLNPYQSKPRPNPPKGTHVDVPNPQTQGMGFYGQNSPFALRNMGDAATPGAQGYPGPQNYTNQNPFQSMSWPSIPRESRMDAPNAPTQRMDFHGQNSPLALRNMGGAVTSGAHGYPGPPNYTNLNPLQSMPSPFIPKGSRMDIPNPQTQGMGFYGQNSPFPLINMGGAATSGDQSYLGPPNYKNVNPMQSMPWPSIPKGSHRMNAPNPPTQIVDCHGQNSPFPLRNMEGAATSGDQSYLGHPNYTNENPLQSMPRPSIRKGSRMDAPNPPTQIVDFHGQNSPLAVRNMGGAVTSGAQSYPRHPNYTNEKPLQSMPRPSIPKGSRMVVPNPPTQIVDFHGQNSPLAVRNMGGAATSRPQSYPRHPNYTNENPLQSLPRPSIPKGSRMYAPNPPTQIVDFPGQNSPLAVRNMGGADTSRVQNYPRHPNYTNENPFQSMPRPSIPKGSRMDIPNPQTQGMGFYGQNSPFPLINMGGAASGDQSYLGPPNYTNENPLQSMPWSSIPKGSRMDAPKAPTQRMDFHGQNSPLALSDMGAVATSGAQSHPGPPNYTNVNTLQSMPRPFIPKGSRMDAPNPPSEIVNVHSRNSPFALRNMEDAATPGAQGYPGPQNYTNVNPLQSTPRPILPKGSRMDAPNPPSEIVNFHGKNSSLALSDMEVAATPKAQVSPVANVDPPRNIDLLLLNKFQGEDTVEDLEQQKPKLLITSTTSDISGEIPSIKKAEKDSCSCSKSKCLRLYCDCLGGSVFCKKTCTCTDCFNNLEHEEERSKAIKHILARNRKAFRTRVTNVEGVHNQGCKCKVSHCLQKYCECFGANIPCSVNCKCLNCKNRSTDDKLIKDELKETNDDVAEPDAENASNGNPDGQNKKTETAQFLSLFNDNVMDSLIESMLAKAAEHPDDEIEGLIKSMEVFSSCFDEINDAHKQRMAKPTKNKRPKRSCTIKSKTAGAKGKKSDM